MDVKMENEALARELLETFFNIKALMRKISNRDGISMTETMVMGIISTAEQEPDVPVRMSDISNALFSSKPAATQVINRLEKKGFVTRDKTDDDKRSVYVSLTEEGRCALEEKSGQVLVHMDALITRLGKENVHMFAEALRNIMQVVYSSDDLCGNCEVDE